MKETTMTFLYVLTLCTALVISGAFIAGSLSADGKADEKTPISDSGRTSKTKSPLFADALVQGRQSNLETTKGVAMLRGKIDSDQAKRAAHVLLLLNVVPTRSQGGN
jgi:hypothetical protein